MYFRRTKISSMNLYKMTVSPVLSKWALRLTRTTKTTSSGVRYFSIFCFIEHLCFVIEPFIYLIISIGKKYREKKKLYHKGRVKIL